MSTADEDALLNDIIRIQHMLDAAREAVIFGADMSFSALESDRLRCLALTRCVEIIGEAASAISADFRANHAYIPWRLIVATRNRLIHAYFDVDLQVLLETIQVDLPNLIAVLETIVST